MQKKMLLLSIELHQPHNDQWKHLWGEEQVVEVWKRSHNVNAQHDVRHTNRKPVPAISNGCNITNTTKDWSTMIKHQSCPEQMYKTGGLARHELSITKSAQIASHLYPLPCKSKKKESYWMKRGEKEAEEEDLVSIRCNNKLR